jgi:RND family efflux transporter MFP subunit
MAKSSIIEESKRAKGKGFFKTVFSKKFFIILIIIIAIGGGAYYYYTSKNAKTKAVIVKKTAVVKQEDLQIAVDTTGKVVAKDGVELSFSNSGSTAEVSDVYVKEGAKVKKGDKIASIKTSSLEFELRNAYSSYQSSLSNLQTKEAGATSDERAKAKNSVDQAKLSLDQAKLSLEQTKTNGSKSIKNAETNVTTAQNNLRLNSDEKTSAIVNDAYKSLVNSLKSINISLTKNLEDADSILDVDNQGINDYFENLLGVKNSGTLDAAKMSYLLAKGDREDLNSTALSLSDNSSQYQIEEAAAKAKSAINSMEKLLYNTKIVLDATITSTALSQSQLDVLKSKISSDRSSNTSLDSNLTSSIQAVDGAKRSLNNYQIAYQKAVDDLASSKVEVAQSIANSENSLATRQSSLESAQISYKDLIAPATSSDLASARAQLTSASINVDKAKYNIEQATLISPIDGVIAQLNYKKGDIVTDNTKSMATIINNDTLFIEVNVEESDINKIKVGQKVKATFDAIDGLSLDGEVSFISLTSQSSSNGIVTYLVRVLFTNPGETQVREGMTAAVKLITAEAPNVLTVPVSAVRNVNNQVSVEKADGTFAQVKTGFTDGTKVEIISGLSLGDKITY